MCVIHKEQHSFVGIFAMCWSLHESSNNQEACKKKESANHDSDSSTEKSSTMSLLSVDANKITILLWGDGDKNKVQLNIETNRIFC